MEPEGSLQCSQEPSAGLYAEPVQSGPYHPILYKIHFNIIHPPISWSSLWSLLAFPPVSYMQHILYPTLFSSLMLCEILEQKRRFAYIS
jgi:hypothetical protein